LANGAKSEESAQRASPSDERAKQAREFVQALLTRYAAYHQHEEAAYAGLTLFGGIAGAAAISSAWTPKWGEHSTVLAIAASVGLWWVVLAFLRFRLSRRRWAALRVAGCERLLASWLQAPPLVKELALADTRERPRIPGRELALGKQGRCTSSRYQ
jgi:hypothetical protein